MITIKIIAVALGAGLMLALFTDFTLDGLWLSLRSFHKT
jgi:hypothetical protein